MAYCCKSSIWKVKEPRELKLIESAEDGEGASSYVGMKRTIQESWSQKQWVTVALNQEKTKPVSSSPASVFFSKDNDLQAFHMRLNWPLVFLPFFFLAVPRSLQGLSSPTGDLTWAPGPRGNFRHLVFVCLFVLFLAVLGLRCSTRASHCGGFSCCGAWALSARASVVVARGLSSCGSWALEHRLSSCGAQA